MNIISKRKINKYKKIHQAYKKCLCYNCFYRFCCFMLSNKKTKCGVYEDDRVYPAKYKKKILRGKQWIKQ